MMLNSDQLRLAAPLDARQSRAVALPVIKSPRGDRIGRGDDAEERLAERVAPRAHRADIAAARGEPAHRVRVHEADDVAARFLAAKRPLRVGGDGRDLTAAIT